MTPATVSISAPSVAVPMPTLVPVGCRKRVLVPKLVVFGIAIAVPFSASVSPAASPRTVLPVTDSPAIVAVVPSNVKLDEPASTPALLYWSCVVDPAAAGDVLIARNMPLAVPSQVTSVFCAAGIVTAEPPARLSTVTAKPPLVLLRTTQRPPTPDGTR